MSHGNGRGAYERVFECGQHYAEKLLGERREVGRPLDADERPEWVGDRRLVPQCRCAGCDAAAFPHLYRTDAYLSINERREKREM